MKKIIGYYIWTSLIKGILLFCLILIGDFIDAIPILLRFLFYFVFIGLIDLQMMNRIMNKITEYRFIKALAFSYLTFVTILWITGPLFKLFNYLTDTSVEGEPKMPTAALVIFLVTGLITSIIVSIIWTKKKKETAANNG